jgi:Spy/CpxP family protein refolding chaperone
MNIRKFLVCAVAVGAMASVSVVNAQDQKKGGGRGMGTPEQRIERLEQAVGTLSAEQKTQIKAIYAKSAEKMQGLSQEERREKGMEIMRESGKEVRAVLTAEQQKKYDEMMAQMGQGRGQGGARGKKKEN